MLLNSLPCCGSGKRLSLASAGSILSTPPVLRDQGGDDGFSIGTDSFALVATDIVDVNLVEAQVEETLDVLAVLIQVVRDQDAALKLVWTHEFCELGEIFK